MKCDCPQRMTSTLFIQKPNDGASTTGGGHVDLSDDANWLTLGSRKCHVFTRGGAERWRFNQVVAEVSRIVQFAYGPLARQIQPRWRLRKRERGSWKAWDVAAAFVVDDKSKVVEVHCKEVVT